MLALACALLAPAQAAEWTPMFNGRDLSGWAATPGGSWTAEDGMIVGRSPVNETRYGVLLSAKVYHNFHARGSFRVIHGDSGFYFRTMRMNGPGSVQGLQMEVDDSRETGGLYESNGRGWVVKLDEAIHDKTGYTPGQWTNFDVRCQGPSIKVNINGVQVVDLMDDRNNRMGRFGLQLHANMLMHVEFKGLEVMELGASR